MSISDERTESSNFYSLRPITAALDNLAIFLLSSIFGNKILTLRWIGFSFLIWVLKYWLPIAVTAIKSDLY